jgi:Uma2 family endonuclease
MTTTSTTIVSPSDHGRRMSLAEFEFATAGTGHKYELSRGTIIVTDVPNPPHDDTVFELRQQLALYCASRPGVVHRIFSGNECKVLVEQTESERHPDLAVYKTPAPAENSSAWSTWVPEIVIEVVSADSVERDYVEKPEDYLHFGVQEYWIVDPVVREMITVLRRSRGRWQSRELRHADRYTTHVLPGFELVAATLLPR